MGIITFAHLIGSYPLVDLKKRVSLALHFPFSKKLGIDSYLCPLFLVILQENMFIFFLPFFKCTVTSFFPLDECKVLHICE